jgi:hypothetical protein
VVAQEGSPHAYATANQQLFFPSGGRYDLGFEGVESVSTTSDLSGMFGGAEPDTGFSGDLVDVGHVVAPRAGVSNLAFREIHVEQAMEWPYALPLRLELSDDAPLRARGAFTNDTPYDLFSVVLWVGNLQVSLGDVKPGETKEINEFLPSIAPMQRSFEQPPLAAGQVAVTAMIGGLAVGATIGKEQGTGPRLLYTYSSVAGKVRR